MRKGTTLRISRIFILESLYLWNHSSYELQTWHEYSYIIRCSLIGHQSHRQSEFIRFIYCHFSGQLLHQHLPHFSDNFHYLLLLHATYLSGSICKSGLSVHNSHRLKAQSYLNTTYSSGSINQLRRAYIAAHKIGYYNCIWKHFFQCLLTFATQYKILVQALLAD